MIGYLFRMSIASILRGFDVFITGMKTALTILAEKNWLLFTPKN